MLLLSTLIEFNLTEPNLASKIIEHVDSFDEITPKLKNGAYKLYRTTLDEIPYLKGSDNIKDKLMRDFQSEFDEKFADKIAYSRKHL